MSKCVSFSFRHELTVSFLFSCVNTNMVGVKNIYTHKTQRLIWCNHYPLYNAPSWQTPIQSSHQSQLHTAAHSRPDTAEHEQQTGYGPAKAVNAFLTIFVGLSVSQIINQSLLGEENPFDGAVWNIRASRIRFLFHTHLLLPGINLIQTATCTNYPWTTSVLLFSCDN